MLRTHRHVGQPVTDSGRKRHLRRTLRKHESDHLGWDLGSQGQGFYEKGERRQLGKSLGLSKTVMKRFFEQERRIFKASQNVRPTKSSEQRFRKACKKVLVDGKMTEEEESQLKSLARFFKMSNDVMKEIFADAVRIVADVAGPYVATSTGLGDCIGIDLGFLLKL